MEDIIVAEIQEIITEETKQFYEDLRMEQQEQM